MTGCIVGKANCRSCAVVDSYYARRRPTPLRAGDRDLAGLGAVSRDAGRRLPGSPDAPVRVAPSRSVFPAGSG
jgi:hypothetical protein